MNALESLINTLKNGEINRVKEAWLTLCDHLDESVIFELNGKKSSGLFLGINDTGSALIKTKEEKIVVSDEEISLKFS